MRVMHALENWGFPWILSKYFLLNKSYFYVEYFYEKLTDELKVVFMQIGGIQINANKLFSVYSILNPDSLIMRVYVINVITESTKKSNSKKSP
jgi:hypothetical protein